jgi:hypothetical protein
MGMAITLTDSINRDSQAHCPKCNELVRCCQLEYIRWGWVHITKFWHPECDTTWKLDINTGESETIDG